MIVKKLKDTINLKLEDEKSLEDILNSEALFWNDLQVAFDPNGYIVLYDTNQNKFFDVQDHFYNLFNTLLENGEATLPEIHLSEEEKNEWLDI